MHGLELILIFNTNEFMSINQIYGLSMMSENLHCFMMTGLLGIISCYGPIYVRTSYGTMIIVEKIVNRY